MSDEIRIVRMPGDPDCPICHGIGYIRYDRDIYDKEFGKMYDCECRLKGVWDAKIGIGIEDAKSLDWNKFQQTEAVKQMRKAYDHVLERGYGWVYIYGVPGNGKTIMAKAFSIYSQQVKGFKTRYRKLSEIMNELRSSYDENFGQVVYQSRLKEWASIRVLVLDEIGRDRQTEFSKQSLSDIMDKRYEDAVQRKSITVWVSNFTPEEILEQYQVDRIRDGRFSVVEVVGKSVRNTLKDQQKGVEAWWQKY